MKYLKPERRQLTPSNLHLATGSWDHVAYCVHWSTITLQVKQDICDADKASRLRLLAPHGGSVVLDSQK